MGYSCCICGLDLADINSSFPQWCKQIRAVYPYGDEKVLSGSGYVENGSAAPFNLAMPQYGNKHFYFRALNDEIHGTCYPFHQTCWSLLTECCIEKPLKCSILFDIFESIPYRSRSLKWGHNYYLEDLTESTSIMASPTISQEGGGRVQVLADPSRFSFREIPLPFRWSRLSIGYTTVIPAYAVMRLGLNHILRGPTILSLFYCQNKYCFGLSSLPIEIFTLIMCNLDFDDLQKLLQASSGLYRRFGADPNKLPLQFWQSRFWISGETGFARSIRPLSYSWKDWFFTIRAEVRKGPNSMGLRNRRRIWKLVMGVANILQAINNPDRALCGDATVPHSVHIGQTTRDAQRGLIERYISFADMSRPCSIIPSYVPFASKKLIAGLSFTFRDGTSADIGYVVKKQAPNNCATLPKFLWVVSSQLGFESFTCDLYPPEISGNTKPIDMQQLAVTRWKLQSISGICLSMDAMRIVRISMHTDEQPGMENIFWTPTYPQLLPVIHEDDVAALVHLQSKSFNPATTYTIESSYGDLTAVNIYSPLGFRAGITGIGFLYDQVPEHLLGTSNEAASLTFFLGRNEHITRAIVYKVKSLVYHLQFITNFNRTSNVFPEVQKSDQIFEVVEYNSLNGGFIKGFSGCFTGSSMQLHCFGVLPSTTAVYRKTRWTLPKIPHPPQVDGILPEMPLGGIRNHGSHRSHISLQCQYVSIQASVNQTRFKYRRKGQVTGLLFYSSNDPEHPSLIGQWTGAGNVYHLHDDERIVDIVVTTINPILRQRSRPGLTQVESITVVTNRMTVRWSPSGCEQTILDVRHKARIEEAFWEFNAIFDRFSCTRQ